MLFRGVPAISEPLRLTYDVRCPSVFRVLQNVYNLTALYKLNIVPLKGKRRRSKKEVAPTDTDDERHDEEEPVEKEAAICTR